MAAAGDAAAQARHEAALRASQVSVLQARCAALAAQRVAVLDETNPAVDFRRWYAEIIKIATVAGKDFYAALFAPETTIVPRTAAAQWGEAGGTQQAGTSTTANDESDMLFTGSADCRIKQ